MKALPTDDQIASFQLESLLDDHAELEQDQEVGLDRILLGVPRDHEQGHDLAESSPTISSFVQHLAVEGETEQDQEPTLFLDSLVLPELEGLESIVGVESELNAALHESETQLHDPSDELLGWIGMEFDANTLTKEVLGMDFDKQDQQVEPHGLTDTMMIEHETNTHKDTETDTDTCTNTSDSDDSDNNNMLPSPPSSLLSNIVYTTTTTNKPQLKQTTRRSPTWNSKSTPKPKPTEAKVRRRDQNKKRQHRFRIRDRSRKEESKHRLNLLKIRNQYLKQQAAQLELELNMLQQAKQSRLQSQR